MRFLLDISTPSNILSTNFPNSIHSNKITKNIDKLKEYSRKANIKYIKAINSLDDMLSTSLPAKPIAISSREYNDIELKNLLLEHKGELFIEKPSNNILKNDNFNKILSFFTANEIAIFGISMSEELFSTAIALSGQGIKVSIINDAILPINEMELNVKSQIETVKEKGILMLQTTKFIQDENGMHIL